MACLRLATRPCRLKGFFLGLALAVPALSQPPAPPSGRPVVTAVRLDEAPVIDGEVLADPAWQSVAAATGFWQTTPDEGQPASERTEVRIAFDAETLYVGVVCYDLEPDKIIATDSRRDASLSETDSFQIILDTFLDRQNGFVFGTNPAGIEYDGQVTGEGSGGFGTSGGEFNRNWDAAWEVEAQVSAIGWSAEMAIPFRTLRFGKGDVQTWGLNLQRNLRRRNETSFWAPLPRQFDLFRLSLAGTVEGVEVPDQRNFKLVPYVLFEGRESVDGNQESDEEVGFDLKYSITPSLTLDATYNTDFAQVEVDEFPDQSRPLQPLLSREAAVLSRERRAVLGRCRRRDRALLQPPHRHRTGRRRDPDRRRRCGSRASWARRPTSASWPMRSQDGGLPVSRLRTIFSSLG